jgi:hypothetical protein
MQLFPAEFIQPLGGLFQPQCFSPSRGTLERAAPIRRHILYNFLVTISPSFLKAAGMLSKARLPKPLRQEVKVPLRVRMRKAQIEQMFSGLAPAPDIRWRG